MRVYSRRLQYKERNGEQQFTLEVNNINYVLSIWKQNVGREEMSGQIMSARFKMVDILSQNKLNPDNGIKFLISVEKIPVFGHGDEGPINAVIEEFEGAIGMTLCQFMKYLNKLHRVCPNCGGRYLYMVQGFPGEHIEICADCLKPTGFAEFNEAEVI